MFINELPLPGHTLTYSTTLPSPLITARISTTRVMLQMCDFALYNTYRPLFLYARSVPVWEQFIRIRNRNRNRLKITIKFCKAKLSLNYELDLDLSLTRACSQWSMSCMMGKSSKAAANPDMCRLRLLMCIIG